MLLAFFGQVATLVGGFYGMNLSHGSYVDGSAPDGGGDSYDEVWQGGPSGSFVTVVVGSTAGAATAIVITITVLRYCGVLLT